MNYLPELGTAYHISESLGQLNSLISNYREYKITLVEEKTRRTAIREQTRVIITKLEAELEYDKEKIKANKEIALGLVCTLNNLLQNKEVLDESSIKICLSILDKIMEFTR